MNSFQNSALSLRWRWTKTPFAKKLFAISRWLHVYLSAIFLCLLLFFCFTGFTLNHASWFTSDGQSGINSYPLPKNLNHVLSEKDTINIAQLKTFIETEFGLRSPRSIDMELDIGEISLDYPIPAGYAFVSILLDDEKIEVEYRTGSLVELLNDLHKGRYTGPGWSLLIDISAILMTLFSIAGLIILLQHKKYRSSGLFFVGIGTLTPAFVYFLFVPYY